MGRIGKIILRKLKVDGYSQTLGSRDRMAWKRGRTSTKETLVFRGYKLLPLNQKVLTQNRVFDLFRDCLGGAF